MTPPPTSDDDAGTPFEIPEIEENSANDVSRFENENRFGEPSADEGDSNAEWNAARAAWDASDADASLDDPAAIALAKPFVGRWNDLVSTTNWEKGRIISQWRSALIESGASSASYSDAAWAARVGGVTAPHVGRLRRVHDRFADQQASYPGIHWSHFLAALDWDDAPLWLQGAVESGWSVAGMRERRWRSTGAVESERPSDSQVITVDVDEDMPDLGTQPAQGGGRDGKAYGDEAGAAAGPRYDDPDFGDEEGLATLSPPESSGASTGTVADQPGANQTPVQPFAGLPELPEDMSDAVEMLKLSILRHRSDGWRDVAPEIVEKYLHAIGVLLSLKA